MRDPNSPTTKRGDLPHVTVACVVERDGHFLIVEEMSGSQLVLNQPAGHVDPLENPVLAAIRECQEETAWQVQPTSIIGLYMYQGVRSKITYQRICFHAQAMQYHPQQPLDDVINQVLWLSLDELKAEQARLRSPMVMRCVEDYLSGQSYPLEIIHDYLQP